MRASARLDDIKKVRFESDSDTLTIKDRQADVEGSRLVVITLKPNAQERARQAGAGGAGDADGDIANDAQSPVRKRSSSIRKGQKADTALPDHSEFEEDEDEEAGEQGDTLSPGHHVIPSKTYTLRAKTRDEAKVFKEPLERSFVEWQNRGRAPPTKVEIFNDRARKLAHSPRLQYTVFGLIVVNFLVSVRCHGA